MVINQVDNFKQSYIAKKYFVGSMSWGPYDEKTVEHIEEIKEVG
ncbi:MAG: hypothetical protein PHS13_06215 [Firmicutes bacterium]|jgi:hypothetical protein|nr:hypothetical protein [Bacillota bacterium]MDD3851197.1 hypothetical protein [Bacillota bacterium]MDD4708180.1 hypothetical protein [Bacillota bacterium]